MNSEPDGRQHFHAGMERGVAPDYLPAGRPCGEGESVEAAQQRWVSLRKIREERYAADFHAEMKKQGLLWDNWVQVGPYLRVTEHGLIGFRVGCAMGVVVGGVLCAILAWIARGVL